jgi:hypothetical protein
MVWGGDPETNGAICCDLHADDNVSSCRSLRSLDFRSETGAGPLRRRLESREQNHKLFITFEVDNHVLKGESETDGKRFAVVRVHSDGSGPGHGERIRLAGTLENDRITGSFDFRNRLWHLGWDTGIHSNYISTRRSAMIRRR